MRLGPVTGTFLTPVVAATLSLTLVGGVAAAAGLLPSGPAATPASVDAAAAADPSPLALALPSLEPLPVAPLPVAPLAVVPSPAGAPAVRPLSTLRAADLRVTVRSPLTPAQVKQLQDLRLVTAVSVVDIGTVQVAGKGARILGVDPSTFRAFTPQETAQSDALWQSVARGELAASYGLARSRKLALGASLPIAGRTVVTGRVGALASYGLPGVDVVTDRATARRLGVVPASAVLVSAPERRIPALRAAVRKVVGASAVVDVLRAEVAAAPKQSRPRTYRDLYVDSVRYCPGLSWTVLAAIGQVESGHGRNLGPSSAGALGPMQFLPSTWAAYGVDGDRDGDADIMDPFDAIPSAAGYLCRFGANRGPDGLYDAIFAYNHADWYVRKVLGVAAQYR